MTTKHSNQPCWGCHHTSPWSYDEATGYKPAIRAADGYVLAYCEYATSQQGQLMAAAPEMLVALEDHLAWMETGEVGGVYFDEESTRSALALVVAKARGETP